MSARPRFSVITAVLALLAALGCSEPTLTPTEVARQYVLARAEGRDLSRFDLGEIAAALTRSTETAVDVPQGRFIRSIEVVTTGFGPGGVAELEPYHVEMRAEGQARAAYFNVWFRLLLDDGTLSQAAVSLRPRADGSWGVVERSR